MTKLNVPERINLMSILPSEGNFIDIGIIRSLKDLLNFDEESLKKFNIKSEGEKLSWNNLGEEEIEFDIKPRAFSIVCNILEKLDKEKRLDINHFTIFEKFITKN